MDKALGALPVVAEFCRRLDIAGIVDRACPVREVAILTHGAVIEALVANRLTSPQPLVHVEGWARAWAVPEVFGIDASALNDDRIGRALDAVAPELEAIVGSVGAVAIAVFGIDVTRLHWDMTSISLYGAYNDAEEGFAKPRFGHPKDRRPDLKQVQTGLAVTADGGIPIFHRAYDGGAGEVAQVVGAMEALRAIASPRTFLMVGDSKLVTYPNVVAMTRAGVTFIAPASKTHVDADTLGAQDLTTATPVAYVAQRDEAKDPDAAGRWWVREDATLLKGPRRADPVVALRRIFVHSSARAGAASAARAKKLAGHGTTLSGWSGDWGAATTRPPRRSTSGWRPSAGSAASRGTCRPASAPTLLAGSPWPGTLTRTPWPPRPPQTAGMPCSPTSIPLRLTQQRCSGATRARRWSSAGTGISRAPWRWRPCSCRTTAASNPS